MSLLTPFLYSTMKEKILAALKTRYANKGFSAKTLESMAEHLANTVTEETQIDNAVSGVEPVLSIFQSEVDNRVTAAVNKAKAEGQQQQQQTQPAGASSNGNPTPPQTGTNDDMPAWAKALAETNQKLAGALAQLQGDQVQKTRSQTLAEKLKEAPEPFKNKILKDFSRMRFETDEDFNAYVTETETDVKEAVQSAADAGLGQFPKPNQGQGSNGNSSAEADIKQWASKKVEEKERN